MNNMRDPVPTIPGRFLGYRHPSGEIHLQADGSAVVCPGKWPCLFCALRIRADVSNQAPIMAMAHGAAIKWCRPFGREM